MPVARKVRWVTAHAALHSPEREGVEAGDHKLAIGDQDGMDDADWRIFNRTGLTHLVSISGSHITMLANQIIDWIQSFIKR